MRRSDRISEQYMSNGQRQRSERRRNRELSNNSRSIEDLRRRRRIRIDAGQQINPGDINILPIGEISENKHIDNALTEEQVLEWVMQRNYNDELDITSVVTDNLLNNIRNLSYQSPGYRLIINSGNQYRTLSPTIIDDIKRDIINEELNNYNLLIQLTVLNQGNFPIILKWVTILQRRKNNNFSRGRFFQYLNKTNLDLSKYGVYKTIEEIDNNIHCLVQSFINSDLFSNDEIQALENMVGADPFPVRGLIDIANKFNIIIQLRSAGNNYREYPKKNKYDPMIYDRIIKLAHLKDHFFINEKTLYSERDLYYYENPVLPSSPFVREYYLDSYTLISKMVENEHLYLKKLVVNEEIYKHKLDQHIKSKDIICPEVTKFMCEEIKSTSKNREVDEVVYFDIETDPISDNTKHIPYAVSYCFESENKCEFIMIKNRNEIDSLGRRFLTDLYTKLSLKSEDRKQNKFSILLIAHNAQYDLQLIYQCCHPQSILKSGLKIKTWLGVFYPDPRYPTKYKLTIHLRDSALIIPKRLCEFSSMFNLPIKKEWFPYNLYTIDNIENNTYIEIPESKKKERDYVDWLIEGKDLGYLIYDKDKDYLHLENYAKFYCTKDVEVLKAGYLIYKEWIKEITGLDINEHITLSHIAKNYMIKEKCFENVYALKRNVMNFIRQCVIGGRNMISNNKPIIIYNIEIEDQDVNSLYPTAMMRMPGFLKGYPYKLNGQYTSTEFTYFLNINPRITGYFVKIFIINIGKKRDFPTLCRKEEGILDWTNDMELKYMYVCKTTLEDLIIYHRIDYKVIEGYYFMNGYNNKIHELVSNVYLCRLKAKAEKNPIQSAYKLLLNSFYGVTLTKPINLHHVFKKEKDIQEYYARKHHWIDKYTLLGTTYFIDTTETKYVEIQERKSLFDTSSCPHIAAEILAWSKRHMNEIMYLADDLNIPIYYTDTDSIHLPRKNIDLLGKEYYKLFNKPLFGDKLGQCSSEWAKDIYSIFGAFLGKKIYLDILNDSNLHFAMKGITKDAVFAKLKETNLTLKDLYIKLFNGEEIQFNNGLDSEGNKKTTFKKNPNGIFSQMEDKLLIKTIKIKKHGDEYTNNENRRNQEIRDEDFELELEQEFEEEEGEKEY